MKGIWDRGVWQKVLGTFTRGADLRTVTLKSLALAICSTIAALPYFHYLIFVATKEGGGRLPDGVNSWELLVTQLFFVLVLSLLSALVGLSFSTKLGLPGLGSMKDLREDMPVLLCLGAVMTFASYYLFDRYFFEVSPLSYPEGALYLISMPFKGAFTEEIILRLCLVTLCVGILKRKGAGMVLASTVASLFTIKYFQFMGIEWGLNYLFMTQILLAFLAHLILGYLFVTRGLFYAMALKFFLGIKYGIVSWTLRM